MWAWSYCVDLKHYITVDTRMASGARPPGLKYWQWKFLAVWIWTHDLNALWFSIPVSQNEILIILVEKELICLNHIQQYVAHNSVLCVYYFTILRFFLNIMVDLPRARAINYLFVYVNNMVSSNICWINVWVLSSDKNSLDLPLSCQFFLYLLFLCLEGIKASSSDHSIRFSFSCEGSHVQVKMQWNSYAFLLLKKNPQKQSSLGLNFSLMNPVFYELPDMTSSPSYAIYCDEFFQVEVRDTLW